MEFLKRLLGVGPKCVACRKSVRPHVVPRGPKTIDQIHSTLKMQPDHAFVCERCGSKICPVCSGRAASAAGLKEFVCTNCGQTPLKKIFR